MVEAFEKIDWESMDHVFGPATDMQAFLRGLLSPSSDQREWAIDELFDVLAHQGTPSQAAIAAVPILYDFLERPGVRGRGDIATLLAAIAQAEAPDPLAEACRQAVGKQLENLLRYLRHREEGVRAMISAAAARYPELAERLVPLLRAALEMEKSAMARSGLEYAINRLTTVSQNSPQM
jgi:hypothetical protein